MVVRWAKVQCGCEVGCSENLLLCSGNVVVLRRWYIVVVRWGS